MKPPRSSRASRSRSRSPGEGGAGSACGAGDAFRVRVHMARYFADERARAYVSVRGARRVRWLRRRLRALFALPPHFALLSRGHLLPPDEPLALLRPDDVVDVVPSRADPEHPGAPRAEHAELAAVARAVVSSPEFAADDSDAAGDGDLIDRSSSAAEPEAEVGAPSPAEPAPEFNGEDDLSEHKRRALNILDRYCGEELFEEAAHSASRPRRRRVRRRRRATPAAVWPAPDAPAAPDAHDAPAASVAPAAPAAGAVLRNGALGGLGARAPRLVRPLGGRSPSCPRVV